VIGAAAERQGTARYLQALAQHWPFILGTLALAVASALLYISFAEKRYEAHADLLVAPVAVGDSAFVGLPVIRETGEGRGVLTAARLVETPGVADSARQQLRTQATREELYESVHVEPQEQSSIVTITAEAGTAERAAAMANAFAAGVIAVRTEVVQNELRPIVERLSRRLDALPEASRDVGEGRALAERLATLRALAGGKDPTLQFASRAVAPAEAAWPRPLLSLVVALLVGLLLGIGVAIALELLNPLVLRDEDVLEERLPLLARVPRTTASDVHRHLQQEASFGADVNDAYQVARVNVTAAFPDQEENGAILVTSASRGEGKTSAAVNLALVYAHAGRRVVLVDTDLRRARLSRVLSVPETRPGVRELVLEQVGAEEALMPVAGYGERLRVLAARSEDGYAFDLLQAQRVEELVEELRSQADIVVLDSPPITEAADGLVLAKAVDAVVLVVRYGRTRRDRLTRARLLLEQLGVVPAGIVAVTRRHARLRERRGLAPAGGDRDRERPRKGPARAHARRPTRAE
jgi:capsular exopolysaccharide synthesis family protein